MMKFPLEFPVPGFALVPKSALNVKHMQGAKPWLPDTSKMLVPVELAIQLAEVSIPQD